MADDVYHKPENATKPSWGFSGFRNLFGGNPLGTLFNVGANIYSQIQTNKNINKQLAAQKQEQQANREYNLKLAQLQNKWNVQAWNMNNQYNSPSAQIQRLREAGLSPDMMYGGGVSGNTNASAPSMTSGAPSASMDYTNLAAKKTIGQSIQEALQNEYTKAQIDNIKADTSKKHTETDILGIEKDFRAAILQGQLETTYLNIKVGNKDMELTDAKIQECQANIRNLDASSKLAFETINRVRAEISNYDADTAYKILKANLDKNLNEATIKKISAETDLTVEQLRSLSEQLPYIITQYKDKHILDSQQIKLNNRDIFRMDVENERIEFEAFMHGPDGWNKEYNFCDNVLHALTRLMDASLGNIVKLPIP